MPFFLFDWWISIHFVSVYHGSLLVIIMMIDRNFYYCKLAFKFQSLLLTC